MPNYKFRFSKHALSNYNKELVRIQRFRNSKRKFDDFECIESLPDPPKIDYWNLTDSFTDSLPETMTDQESATWDIDYDQALQHLYRIDP